MFASIRRGDVVPGAAPEIAQRVEESFLPMISGEPGFLAYYFVSAPDDQAVAITIFEDREGAEASSRKAVEWVKENIASLVPSPLQITEGEVLVSKVA